MSLDKVLISLATAAAAFVLGSAAWHDFVTVPTVAAIEQSQQCDTCVRECKETCRQNGIPLDSCNCAHCATVCR